MNFILFFNIITPFIVVLMSLVLSLLYSKKITSFQNKRITKAISLYFAFGALNWGIIIFYVANPDVFVYLNSLLFLSLMLVHVFFYKFLFILTRINSDKKFSNLHFVFPVVAFLLLTIIMLSTPYKDQLAHVSSGLKFSNTLFSIVSDSKFSIRSLFSLIYTVLSLHKLLKYHKEINNYTSNHDKSSLKWLTFYFFLSLELVVAPVLVILDLISLESPYFLVFTFIIVSKYILLIWNVIQENHILLEELRFPESDDSTPYAITTVLFEKMMAEKRPFLDADIRLNDISLLFNTNRSYLSSFINNTYGVNFNTLMNRYRLKEFNRMKQDEENTKTIDEMIELSGFSNYRNYKYFLKNNPSD